MFANGLLLPIIEIFKLVKKSYVLTDDFELDLHSKDELVIAKMYKLKQILENLEKLFGGEENPAI